MQAGLSLCWSHIPHCWKSHVAAHLSLLSTGQPRKTRPDITEKLLTGTSRIQTNKQILFKHAEVCFSSNLKTFMLNIFAHYFILLDMSNFLWARALSWFIELVFAMQATKGDESNEQADNSCHK